MMRKQAATTTELGNNSPMARPLPEPNEKQAVALWTTAAEREQLDSMADLYAIIVTVEHLEKQYVRDTIAIDEYTVSCSRLIAQFKIALAVVQEYMPSVESFMAQYEIKCPLAMNRLLKAGVPATVEHVSATNGSDASAGSAKIIAEIVQASITVMDLVKLDMVAVDELHPPLTDLVTAMRRLGLRKGVEPPGTAKIAEWQGTLAGMKASEKLAGDQARQLYFDLEAAHNEFYRSLD